MGPDGALARDTEVGGISRPGYRLSDDEIGKQLDRTPIYSFTGLGSVGNPVAGLF